jgi:hypothetical protein
MRIREATRIDEKIQATGISANYSTLSLDAIYSGKQAMLLT